MSYNSNTKKQYYFGKTVNMKSKTTTLSFRCPSDILDAIDSIGRQHYPTIKNSKTNSGCDRSKTLFHIIQAGIAALSDGGINIEVRQTRQNVRQVSNTGIDQEELEELVKKLIVDQQVRQSSNTDNVRQFEDFIKSSLEDGGDIHEAIAQSYASMMGQFNDLQKQVYALQTQLVAIRSQESPIIDPIPVEVSSQELAITDQQSLDLNSQQEIINLIGLKGIVNGDIYYKQLLIDEGIDNKILENIEKLQELGISISKKYNSPVKRLNFVLKELGYSPKNQGQKNIGGKTGTETYKAEKIS